MFFFQHFACGMPLLSAFQGFLWEALFTLHLSEKPGSEISHFSPASFKVSFHYLWLFPILLWCIWVSILESIIFSSFVLLRLWVYRLGFFIKLKISAFLQILFLILYKCKISTDILCLLRYYYYFFLLFSRYFLATHLSPSRTGSTDCSFYC